MNPKMCVKIGFFSQGRQQSRLFHAFGFVLKVHLFELQCRSRMFSFDWQIALSHARDLFC